AAGTREVNSSGGDAFAQSAKAKWPFEFPFVRAGASFGPSPFVFGSYLGQTTAGTGRPSRSSICFRRGACSESTNASFASEFSKKFVIVSISPCGSSGTQTAPRYSVARYAIAQQG